MIKRITAMLTACLCAVSAGSGIRCAAADDSPPVWYDQAAADGIVYIDSENGSWTADISDIQTPDCVIPETFQEYPVTEIWCGAPQKYITTLTVPSSVVSIDVMYCSELQEFRVSEQNERFSSADGVLYDKAGETLIYYPPAKDAASFAVPEGVQTVGQYAFYKCDKLTEVTLPESLTVIEDGAFHAMRKLTKLTIPAQVTKIKAQYFGSALETVTFCCEDADAMTDSLLSEADWYYSDMFREFAGFASVYVPDAAFKTYTVMFDREISKGVIEVLPMGNELPEEIRAEIDRLQTLLPHGEFQRRIAELRGILDVNTPRITAEQVAEILQDDPSPAEIVERMDAIHGYPDYIRRGDPTWYEYWLDDKGSEKIVHLKDSGILFYYEICEDGTIDNISLLYPPDIEFEYVKDPATDIDRTYVYYNQISQDAPAPVIGDVNRDGVFSIADAVLLQKWLLSAPDTELADRKAADFNGDGIVNAADLSMMKLILSEQQASL